jgi:hypothetical protein
VKHDIGNAQWRLSSYSGGSGGNGVEVATNLVGVVAVRDSADPNGPMLVVGRDRWDAFTRDIKNGEPSPGR